jgi:large subunit ribosomal protein L23
VKKDARKEEIAKMSESLFGVKVLGVNTANFKGKIKKTKKGSGKRSDFKKAIITVKPGNKIDLFEIETPEESEKLKVKGEKQKESK